MRPTREGRHTPLRPGLVTVGIGVDPGTVTEEPEEPTDRASSSVATIPYLPPPEVGPTEDLNLAHGTDSDGGGDRPVVDPTNANDGSLSSQAYRASYFNGGGTDTWWVEADLGAAYDVDEIVIRGGWGNSGENDPPWEIEHSPDGSAWTTAAGSYVWDGTTSPKTATLTLTATQNKRYWRVGQTITFSGLVYPAKVHSFEINGPSSVSPSNVLWIDAPLTVDEDDTTFEVATDDSVAAADDLAFWRVELGDSYLIASLTAEIGFETAGSVTVELQAGNESDYSDAVSIATDTLTATGSFTADTVAMSWTPTDVYRYWQLLIDAADGVHIFEVSLFDPATFTGEHGDLTGRDVADQHPADAVSYDNATSGLTATDVQAAIDEVAGADTLGWFVVTEYGATGDGTTNDTAAIQATIDAAVTAQGGVIYFPPGEYLVSGSLQDTGAFNGQLLLPNVDHADPHIVLTFRGALRPGLHPVYGSDPLDNTGYSIIRSSLTGASGTAACISAGNDWDPPSSGGGNNLSVNVEDLICVGPNNPTFTFWNLGACQGGAIRDLQISTPGGFAGTPTEPTNSNSYGIKLPQIYFSNYTRTEGLSVGGFYTGVLNGELAMHHGLILGICIVGLEQPEMFYPSVIFDMTITSFQYGIRFTGGDSRLDILSYTAEHSTDPPFDPWHVTIYDVDDPSDFGHGYHRWFCAETGGAPDHSFIVNGGDNLGNQEVGADWGTGASGAAGGDLSGTYPNPSVVDDSHNHTAATLPATAASGRLLIADVHSSPIVFDDILQADDFSDFLYSEA